MAWISGNYALNQSQMDNNAREFYNYFSGSWTVNAIAGALGNAWRESTVNPGVWQNYKAGNMNLGFGLMQWTPASKLISWCKENGLDSASGEAQCKRIEWEYANGQQYYKTSAYPLTFAQYIASDRSPEYLAEVWLYNYERAASATADLAGRKKWARYFFELLEGQEPVEPTPEPGVPDPPDPSEKPFTERLIRYRKYNLIARRTWKKWQA